MFKWTVGDACPYGGCKNIEACTSPHLSVSSRAAKVYGGYPYNDSSKNFVLATERQRSRIYAAQPLSRYKRGDLRNYKVNFASQKRSFTCLASLVTLLTSGSTTKRSIYDVFSAQDDTLGFNKTKIDAPHEHPPVILNAERLASFQPVILSLSKFCEAE